MSPRPFGRVIKDREAYSGIVEMIFKFPTGEQTDQITAYFRR
jgi:ubiquinone/menaquinone biosynthesis C-methylase UbiE